MSRTVSVLTVRWFVLLAAVLVLSPATSFGAAQYTAGSVSGNEYEDQVLGAGHTEGDIWGGEQGADPWLNPEGPTPSEYVPIINTLPGQNPQAKPGPKSGPKSGHAGWLVQLASVFDWLQTSLRFSNPN